MTHATTTRPRLRWVAQAMATAALSGGTMSGAMSSAWAQPTAPATPRLYEITTRTGMPHLEDNLRYATRTEKRCLDERTDWRAHAFWMLGDVSLSDCTLVRDNRATDAEGEAIYLLQCTAGHGTSGSALWRTDGEQALGRLKVRLGGKNMTFYQEVTARPLGKCP